MKQTILHIIPRFYPGGAERLVLEYATRLNSEKFEMHVASAVAGGELLPLFEQTEASLVVATQSGLFGRIQTLLRLKKYIKKTKPDIIHTHLLTGDGTGFLITLFFPHITWVSTMHNTHEHRPLLYRVFWKIALKRVDRVIAVSKRVQTYVIKKFGVSKEKVVTIPNGIDLRAWEDISSDSLFDSKPYQFATVGRLEEQKGHTYLLDALAKLEHTHWEYHVYGDGSRANSLRRQAQRIGIADKVQFHGIVTNLPERIKTIDLIIQPSLWEGMSLTVMEAMAASRPVLATEPAAEEILEHKKTGYVVPADDVDAFAEALSYIIENTDEAKHVARRGREKSLEAFKIEKHVNRVETLYQSLVTNH